MALLAPPVKARSAGLKRQRVSFLLDTFLWTSKEKYLALGGETPIQTSVAAATPYFLIARENIRAIFHFNTYQVNENIQYVIPAGIHSGLSCPEPFG
jgi:hypothetical protein